MAPKIPVRFTLKGRRAGRNIISGRTEDRAARGDLTSSRLSPVSLPALKRPIARRAGHSRASRAAVEKSYQETEITAPIPSF